MAHSMINDVYMPIAPETSDGKLPSTRNVAIVPEATEWKLPSSRKVAVVCLILTETGLFSIFVAGYVFYLGKSLTGPTPREVLDLPILSTICLLSSSVTITLAERATAWVASRFFGWRQLYWRRFFSLRQRPSGAGLSTRRD